MGDNVVCLVARLFVENRLADGHLTDTEPEKQLYLATLSPVLLPSI